MPSDSIFSPFREWWARLDGRQQFSLLVFGPCAFIVVCLSLFQFRFLIVRPFRVSDIASRQAEQLLLSSSSSQITALSGQKDTDQDGLSDADEVNVYHTSPYLKDTDSDGLADGQEVKNGTNPNCPQGKECFAEGVTNSDAVMDGAPSATTTMPAVVPPALSPPTPPAQMTAAKIRAYLVTNQLMSDVDAGALSDEDVVQLYGRIYDQLVGVQKNLTAPTVAASSTNSATVDSTRSSSAP